MELAQRAAGLAARQGGALPGFNFARYGLRDIIDLKER